MPLSPFYREFDTDADRHMQVAYQPPPVEEPPIDEAPEPEPAGQVIADADLQRKRQMFDTLRTRFQGDMKTRGDSLARNRVSAEEVAANADNARTNAFLGNLASSTAKIGNFRGKAAGSDLGKTATEMNKINADELNARQALADDDEKAVMTAQRGIVDVDKSSQDLETANVDYRRKVQQANDENEKRDWNSEVSRTYRTMLAGYGVNLGEKATAAQIEKQMPFVKDAYNRRLDAEFKESLAKQTQEANLARSREEREFRGQQAGADRALRRDIANASAEARKATAGSKADRDVMNTEMDLAKRFRSEKPVQAYEAMSGEMGQIERLAAVGTPETDQALITKFAKILDPGSVVRETEFAITESNGGLITKVENILDKGRGTGRLQKEQRAALMQAARELMAGIRPQYDRLRGQYEDDASAYSLDPVRVVGRSLDGNTVSPDRAVGGGSPVGSPDTANIPVWKPSRAAGR
jgi:hypothetical protein